MGYLSSLWFVYWTVLTLSERVQRQAARFITGDYRTREEGCVTGMLQSELPRSIP